jgi:hypothetical protein
MSILPAAAVPWLDGASQYCALAAAGIPAAVHAAAGRVLGISPFYGLTHPLGALILGYMLARSAVVTLWKGGVEWRGTFYPLEDLRRGVV